MTTETRPNGTRRAADDHARVLVDPRWIAEHLQDADVRLVEVDVSPAAYEAGHIPGAVLWNAYTDLRHRDYAAIDSTELAALLSRSGISPASTIVFYGYGAYLGFWLMKRYGHNRVLLMDGPRNGLKPAEYGWIAEKPTITASSYELTAQDPALVASREVVQELIGRPEASILDVRSQDEFAGERFWPSGATEEVGRAGHIPGATHLPFELIRDDEQALRSPAELRALFDAHGVRPERPIVTYCTIGNRASQVWFALKYVLGYPDVSVYYGSWVEWGRLPGTPIET